MTDYEVVYSAALERQGLGLSLSTYRGNSTLTAFAAEDSLHFGDINDAYKRAQAVRPYHYTRHGRGPANIDSPWHANRSKRAA